MEKDIMTKFLMERRTHLMCLETYKCHSAIFSSFRLENLAISNDGHIATALHVFAKLIFREGERYILYAYPRTPGQGWRMTRLLSG